MPLSAAQVSAVSALGVAHPRALAAYAYGTSGFRGLATTLDSTVLRCGMLAALRSAHCAQRAAAASSPSPVVGLVITASHNDAPDNGVKLVDPSGGMMEQQWESVATRLANADEKELAKTVQDIAREHSIDLTRAGRVFLARDTRQSSPHLAKLATAGVQALGGEVTDFGLATTPQLHWMVREENAGRVASLAAYYKCMSDSFRQALDCKPPSSEASAAPAAAAAAAASSVAPAAAAASASSRAHELSPLVLDCANGVGFLSIEALAPMLSSVLVVEKRNTGDGGLNHHCGAEHVQKARTLPAAFSAADKGKKLASLDGDADRLVYFFLNAEGQFRLLDGDKIIALYTLFLRDLLRTACLDKDLRIGIVQTAYANGASTLYMRDVLQAEVHFTNTGVKHLHHKAVEFDVGVYFESNGHGTVVFSERAFELIAKAAANEELDQAQRRAARCLAALLTLINQGVGDAISDMLLVEVALYHRGWTLSDWDAVYEDLPSVMLKVKVADRSVLTTTDAERRCVTPAGLQAAIDAIVAAGPGGVAGVRRSFVRPSGTEDIVRVYAEAETKEEVDELAKKICDVTHQMAGGV